MKTKFTVFYSWQSDIKENRNRINDCLEKAIKSIKKAKPQDIELEVNLDRDTLNQSGSPEIAKLILDKIYLSDIFVCDITSINNTWFNRILTARLTPNPNVLMELGFAVCKLGWERIICINNIKYGGNELSPFDIRGHRILTYNSREERYKENLTATLISAITAIISDYPAIEKKHNLQNHKVHDNSIFQMTQKICNETELKEGINHAINDLFTNDYVYDTWDNIIQFYKDSMNYFIDIEVDSTFKNFLQELDKFRMLCATKFFAVESSKQLPTLMDYKEAGIEITDEVKREVGLSYVYRPHKEPFSNETYPQADKRIHHLQNELYDLGKNTIDAYQKFIMVIKKNVLIHTK